MRRIFALSAILALTLTGLSSAQSFNIKLPIPGFDISADMTAWSNSFNINKMTYDPDKKEIVFILQAKRHFSFRDDGFSAPFKFYDADGFNMVNGTNLKYETNPKVLKEGQLLHCWLTLPKDDILQKTKIAQASLHGFYMSGQGGGAPPAAGAEGENPPPKKKKPKK